MTRKVTGRVLALEHLPPELAPVLDYWRTITPPGAVGPTWPAFDLLQIPSRYLPFALVVDRDPKTDTYRYRFWGSRLTDVFGNDYTGKTFDDFPDSLRDVTNSTYSAAVEHRGPIFQQFEIEGDGVPFEFQKVFRLPLSDDGHEVTGVFSILLYPWPYEDLKEIGDRLNLAE